MTINKEDLARYFYYLILALYMLPYRINIFGIGFNLFELILILSAFLFQTKFSNKFNFYLVLFTLTLLLSNLFGLAVYGYEFNLKNFMFIKFSLAYYGAINLGQTLNSNTIINKKYSIGLLIALFCLTLFSFPQEK